MQICNNLIFNMHLAESKMQDVRSKYSKEKDEYWVTGKIGPTQTKSTNLGKSNL